ncbi:MAG: sortase [Candidatus Saccharimonadales bacterium]
MNSNPLFPNNNPIKPAAADQAAVELIRAKVSRAYGEEPAAAQELAKVKKERVLSKHQLFMQELGQSGRSLAEIQTEWHHYYTQLGDVEKREVWEEFYAANQHTPYQKLFQKQVPVATRKSLQQPMPMREVPTGLPTQPAAVNAGGTGVVIGGAGPSDRKLPAKKKGPSKTGQLMRKTKVGRKIADSNAALNAQQLKHKIQDKVSAGGKLETKHHVQSLLFGLGVGAIVLLIMLFGFFNEFIIAPFIQPSRTVTDTPIILANNTAASANPTVVVPKINIQIPIDFGLNSTDEATIQNSLNNGVVHYSNTALPGQNGNGAYFGHSSQNVFNNGKYKFAFVLLHQVTTGDVFSIIYKGKVYYYQVFAKEVVPPTQVSVLSDTKGEQATAVLITCDPPGFSTNRLVVWGKQISPSPSTNTAADTQIAATTPAAPVKLTSNGPTLWTRMWRGVQFWK